MNIQMFKKGFINPELNASIIADCGLESYTSMYQVLEKMYHVDTHNSIKQYAVEPTQHFWRLQGYVFIKDFANSNIYLPEGEISYMGGDYILFFTQRILFKNLAI